MSETSEILPTTERDCKHELKISLFIHLHYKFYSYTNRSPYFIVAGSAFARLRREKLLGYKLKKVEVVVRFTLALIAHIHVALISVARSPRKGQLVHFEY